MSRPAPSSILSALGRGCAALAVAGVLSVLVPGPGTGQGIAQEASLVADRVEVAADGRLIAEGNVETIYGGARLTASRIVYTPDGERLEITGPLVLSQGGGSFVLASSAEIGSGLRDGLLRSARLVLDRRLQLAAAEVAQGDRFTRLSRVTASGCSICSASETPLWEIRARRVIRDNRELQLYFESAQLRMMGVPVFWLPTLRLPDPSLDRSAGFLVPEVRTRSGLSTGLATPYFIPLGEHADVTLTPYLSSRTMTVEGRARQELSFGRIDLEGAVSQDDLRPDSLRGYLFADGRFRLPRDYTLSVDLRLASDSSYLLDYGYSESDRLESRFGLERVRRNRRFQADLSSFRSLRAIEDADDSMQPDRVFDLEWTDRIAGSPDLGDVWITLSGLSIERPSSEAVGGRDTGRLSAEIDWQTMRVLGPGMVLTGEAGLAHDRYVVSQDPRFDATPSRSAPEAAVSLAFPLARTDSDGAHHLLEPKVRLAWSRVTGDAVPNEDSTGSEFDEGNLFAMSRFPGRDRREDGARAEAGLTWTRMDPAGWSLSATGGRILRFDTRDQYGAETGLSGRSSDWLLGASFRLGGTLAVDSRSLLAPNLEFVRSESRIGWTGERIDLSGTHLWRRADPGEGRFDDLNEVTLDGEWRVDGNWALSGLWRYDADSSQTTRTGLGVGWKNECMGVDLSLSRRFTSSTNVDPATEVDVKVYLTGFGTGGDPRVPARRCNG